MVDHEATQTVIKPVKWQNYHDQRLAIAAGDKKDLAIVKNQVNSGVAILWECRYKQYHAHVVTRHDIGDELCVVLFEGSGLMHFGPMILKAARDQNLTVRAHVKRKGMIKMLERLGLTITETVLRG